jgi:hypothetical protein
LSHLSIQVDPVKVQRLVLDHLSIDSGRESKKSSSLDQLAIINKRIDRICEEIAANKLNESNNPSLPKLSHAGSFGQFSGKSSPPPHTKVLEKVNLESKVPMSP